MSRPSLAVSRDIGDGGQAAEEESLKHDIVIGKDILELLSSAMYVDPLTIYREYIQNSADAIDEAQQAGLLASADKGRIDIRLDRHNRTVTIRDNGIGLSETEFEHRMTAFGASKKRGTNAQGFRGVGRLSGLGYCQELVFRSKTVNDRMISEIAWDARKLKLLLQDPRVGAELHEVVREVALVSAAPPDGYPEHFFEVELKNIIRHGNDSLLNVEALDRYIGQIAPVPFAPDFSFGRKITAALSEHLSLGEVSIYLDGRDKPVYRPHRHRFAISDTNWDRFTDLELFKATGMDGDVSAVGWVLHHSYLGAIRTREGIKGLRLRTGNMQVGGHNVLEDIFPETRFSSWTVGEIHVIDRKIVPNGRRDHFEQDTHLLNLLNQLAPRARAIAKRCRASSMSRNRIKQFELEELKINQKADVLEQAVLPKTHARMFRKEIGTSLSAMEKVIHSELLDERQRALLARRLNVLKKRVLSTSQANNEENKLGNVPAAKRKMYEEIIGLIYECSANRVAAKSLVDKILARIALLS